MASGGHQCQPGRPTAPAPHAFGKRACFESSLGRGLRTIRLIVCPLVLSSSLPYLIAMRQWIRWPSPLSIITQIRETDHTELDNWETHTHTHTVEYRQNGQPVSQARSVEFPPPAG